MTEEIVKSETIVSGLMTIKKFIDARKAIKAVNQVATVADVESFNDDNDKFTHGAYMIKKEEDEDGKEMY